MTIMNDVDALAAFIREINGNNRMGAGTLAERIVEWQALKQPIVLMDNGIFRFKENRIVSHLLDFATPLGCGMNQLAHMDFTADERMQFAQLIGYSVSGYGDLSYASAESVACADEVVSALLNGGRV